MLLIKGAREILCDRHIRNAQLKKNQTLRERLQTCSSGSTSPPCLLVEVYCIVQYRKEEEASS